MAELRLIPRRLIFLVAALIAGTPCVVNSDDFGDHVRRLEKKLPSGDFKIIVQRPFVVIGDESQEQLRSRAEHTVKWAVDRLKKDYFVKEPDKIINIWLFKDKKSYERNTELLFGSKPHTPFGYYSSENQALVMNISTGGGTLVHEIVHPFIEANFPECPSWFNEGLASLYEQCRERNGKIWGSTNWRLRGLQSAIRGNAISSFEELCQTSRREFYEDNRGVNYAQARYLCYYLQEQDKLREFYHEFRENVATDPTGFQTLQRLLGRSDMEDFQNEWEEFVLKLSFP